MKGGREISHRVQIPSLVTLDLSLSLPRVLFVLNLSNSNDKKIETAKNQMRTGV